LVGGEVGVGDAGARVEVEGWKTGEGAEGWATSYERKETNEGDQRTV